MESLPCVAHLESLMREEILREKGQQRKKFRSFDLNLLNFMYPTAKHIGMILTK